jgi:hypothetical protein
MSRKRKLYSCTHGGFTVLDENCVVVNGQRYVRKTDLLSRGPDPDRTYARGGARSDSTLTLSGSDPCGCYQELNRLVSNERGRKSAATLLPTVPA